MAHREFTFGSLVRLRLVTQQDGNLIDPSTVTLIIEEPDGVELTVTLAAAEVIRESLGTFYYDYSAGKDGTVEYRWKTGSPQGAKENYFVIPPSRVATP